MNQISDSLNWVESHSHSLRKTLNQDFINWATEEFANEGGFSKASEIIQRGPSSEREDLYADFLSSIERNPLILTGFTSPKEAHEAFSIGTISSDNERSSLQQSARNELSSRGLHPNFVREKEEQFEAHHNQRHQETGLKLEDTRRHLTTHRENIQSQVSEKSQNTSQVGRLLNKTLGKETLLGGFAYPVEKDLQLNAQKEQVPSVLDRLLGNVPKKENLAGKYQNPSLPFWADQEDKQ